MATTNRQKSRGGAARAKRGRNAADVPELDLGASLERITARLERIELANQEQHLLVMKFLIVRSISILTLLVERSSAPERVRNEALRAAEEATTKIARATSLEELHEIDPQLQTQLKDVVRTFVQL